MFWRFGGYANISTIDTILDKPDFALEDLLDETDLIQELKQHNSKLIEYLREDAILKKLLAYVVAPKLETFIAKAGANDDGDDTADGAAGSALGGFSQGADVLGAEEHEEQERKRNRYALVACEILSSDTWSIYESLTEDPEMIRQFWNFLSRPAPLDPLQASYFTKVNESLFEKKTEDMMHLLQSLPTGISDLLKHVESPMIMDLLLKIIALDRTDGGHGIVEWLYSKNLIPTLLSFISPEHGWVVQTAAGDFLKAIITISANASQNEQQCIGPNELTRQLVSEECVKQLIGYMLNGGNPLTVGVGVVIEVIRKNNSDYDPDVVIEAQHAPTSRDPIYLGTLLRLFAENVPKFMTLIMEGPRSQNSMDSTFGERLEPLGFDRFKTCELMAELLHCSNMGLLNEAGIEKLINSRDAERHRLREWGTLNATRDDDQQSGDDLTMNMAHDLSGDGRRLEVTNAGDDGFEDVAPDTEDHSSSKLNSSDLKTDEDNFVDEPLTSPRLDASKDKVVEQAFENLELVVAPLSPSKPPPVALATELEAANADVSRTEPKITTEEVEPETSDAPTGTTVQTTVKELSSLLLPTSASGDSLPSIRELSPHPEDTPAPLFSSAAAASSPVASDAVPASAADDKAEKAVPEAEETTPVEAPATLVADAATEPLVGDYLKMQFVEHRVVPVILSFFFKYPWNNFLHNVVYDIVQQVFNGPMDRGYNPTLAVSLFGAADITTAIIEGQNVSDESQAKNKTRMGYMGHLTLIAEEVVKFTERHPPELLSETVLDKVMSQGWITYVEGALAETRERDNAILGGVRPEVALSHRESIGAGGGLTLGLGGTSGGGSSALAQAGLNGGLGLDDNGSGSSLGAFTITSNTLISGFGSSSDEDDDDGDVEDEDVNSEVSPSNSDEPAFSTVTPDSPPDVIMKSPEPLSPELQTPVDGILLPALDSNASALGSNEESSR
ncbi:hypothetical protein VHEMI08189 [[Torrubiella] hemipterigena]|uniref:Extragenic suppressor of kinetochore protein 1 n=1 Tax=[Torrubiella] hemipterigena TaxID=1531966 RepID=A0A0A1TP88_9HYPO|nr:hypothetical protein VHEMI08189 [[Torrubiella] hemipterigena]